MFTAEMLEFWGKVAIGVICSMAGALMALGVIVWLTGKGRGHA